MSVKLSLKSLKSAIVDSGPFTYEELVEHLDAGKIVYSNELALKGMLQEAVDRKLFALTDGKYVAKPKMSTGGAAPTKMFFIDRPAEPAKAKLVEKPYDAEKAAADELIATTPLGAIKAAKAFFYRTVYWPGLEIYRKLEDEHAPQTETEEAEEAEATA
jgi:hypothetical protein